MISLCVSHTNYIYIAAGWLIHRLNIHVVITTLANLSLQSGKFPSCYKNAQSVTAVEEARAIKFVAAELQANLEHVYNLHGSSEACVDSSASLPDGSANFG